MTDLLPQTVYMNPCLVSTLVGDYFQQLFCSILRPWLFLLQNQAVNQCFWCVGIYQEISDVLFEVVLYNAANIERKYLNWLRKKLFRSLKLSFCCMLICIILREFQQYLFVSVFPWWCGAFILVTVSRERIWTWMTSLHDGCHIGFCFFPRNNFWRGFIGLIYTNGSPF